MPNLVGMIGKNVIPQLENLGYRVDYKGVGKITGQFPAEGANIGKNQKNLSESSKLKLAKA